MTRPFNFSPGPAALPEPVLREAAAEMLDWHGTGTSVMEMSHRGKEFMSIQAEAEADLRELLAIPANYKVLFLQGGAIGQNAIVPMNLLRGRASVDYVDTGDWSRRSMAEAAHYATVRVAASAEGNGYTAIPPQSAWSMDPQAAYIHICSNETIGGLEYHWTPRHRRGAAGGRHVVEHPLAPDRRGALRPDLRRRPEERRPGRPDLRDRARRPARAAPCPTTPQAFDYTVQAANNSMINTPPTYAIYMAGLVFRWLKAQGGLPVIEAQNAQTAPRRRCSTRRSTPAGSTRTGSPRARPARS